MFNYVHVDATTSDLEDDDPKIFGFRILGVLLMASRDSSKRDLEAQARASRGSMRAGAGG